MTILTKEQILKANDIKKQKVSVPEWGGDVYIKTMTGTERDVFEQSLITDKRKTDITNIRAKLCVLTTVDGKDERLFNEGDIQALGAKSAAALDRVFSVSQKLSGIGKSDIEEMAKNSAAAPSEGSTSN